MSSADVSVNIRLGEPAYKAFQALAKSRGVSMNKSVQDKILAASAAERKAKLRQAFAKTSALSSINQDVEFSFGGQLEVVLESK